MRERERERGLPPSLMTDTVSFVMLDMAAAVDEEDAIVKSRDPQFSLFLLSEEMKEKMN